MDELSETSSPVRAGAGRPVGEWEDMGGRRLLFTIELKVSVRPELLARICRGHEGLQENCPRENCPGLVAGECPMVRPSEAYIGDEDRLSGQAVIEAEARVRDEDGRECYAGRKELAKKVPITVKPGDLRVDVVYKPKSRG